MNGRVKWHGASCFCCWRAKGLVAATRALLERRQQRMAAAPLPEGCQRRMPDGRQNLLFVARPRFLALSSRPRPRPRPRCLARPRLLLSLSVSASSRRLHRAWPWPWTLRRAPLAADRPPIIPHRLSSPPYSLPHSPLFPSLLLPSLPSLPLPLPLFLHPHCVRLSLSRSCYAPLSASGDRSSFRPCCPRSFARK